VPFFSEVRSVTDRPADRHARLLLLAAIVALAACQPRADRGAPASLSVARPQIAARNASLAAAALRGDADAVASHYAEDATLFATSSGPDVHGRAAIRAVFGGVFAASRVERASLRTTGLVAEDSLVVESGRFTYQFRAVASGSVSCERGSYRVTWRQEADGEWRIVADHSTYDPDAAPGPCAPDA
jgi:uncharacterized protein (TIGR02246 family)